MVLLSVVRADNDPKNPRNVASRRGTNVAMSRAAVIGAGYVGLTTAACFAHLGHDVHCADVDAERVARLKKGEVPILELGLPELIKEGLAARRLEFVVGAATAAQSAQIVFLCVQT